MPRMRKKRHALTLIEIMVVLFLVALVISVLTYSMKGSMEQGRAFKTQQHQRQLQQLIHMAAAQTNTPLSQVVSEPVDYLKTLGIVDKPEKLLIDGWGQEMTLTVDEEDRILIDSPRYRTYMQKKHGPNWTPDEG